MAIYRVIRSRKSDSDNPIIVISGEHVKCIEESDSNGDWAGWTLCENINNQGWIPTQIIDRTGDDGIILEDYNAIEFDIEVDELILASKTLNGWIWGMKKNSSTNEAWIPLNHVELYKD